MKWLTYLMTAALVLGSTRALAKSTGPGDIQIGTLKYVKYDYKDGKVGRVEVANSTALTACAMKQLAQLERALSIEPKLRLFSDSSAGIVIRELTVEDCSKIPRVDQTEPKVHVRSGRAVDSERGLMLDLTAVIDQNQKCIPISAEAIVKAVNDPSGGGDYQEYTSDPDKMKVLEEVRQINRRLRAVQPSARTSAGHHSNSIR